MFKMKKISALILALFLLPGLWACAKPSVEADDKWFEDSWVINTEFTREFLAVTKTTSTADIFGAAQNWAVEFVSENYKAYSPSQISTDFVSGSNSVPSIFTGMNAVFSTMSYYVRFKTETAPEGLTADEPGFYGFHLQVVMKNENDILTLLGFVTNQARQITRPVELAQFLKAIPGYENLQVMAPVVETPVTAINLTEKTGGLRVINATSAGDALYVLGLQPNYLLAGKGDDVEQTDGVLKVFSTKDFKLLYEYPLKIDFLKARFFDAVGSDMIFSPDISDSGSYYRATKTGVTKLETALEIAQGIYRLSDSAVIKQSEGSLLLEKDGKTAPILTGVPYDIENDNMGETSAYHFSYRLSDTSFVYQKFGYEWTIECGIYDIETGKTTVITHINADKLYPVSVGGGKIVLVADMMEAYTSYGPYLYDTASGEIVDLAWYTQADDGDYPTFGLFGNTLAALSKENGGFTIRLCDLSSETTPRIYRISDYEAAQPGAVYHTDGMFWFATDAYSLSDTYFFSVSVKE